MYSCMTMVIFSKVTIWLEDSINVFGRAYFGNYSMLFCGYRRHLCRQFYDRILSHYDRICWGHRRWIRWIGQTYWQEEQRRRILQTIFGDNRISFVNHTVQSETIEFKKKKLKILITICRFLRRFYVVFGLIYTYYFIWTVATICDTLLIVQWELVRNALFISISNTVFHSSVTFILFIMLSWIENRWI